MIKIGRKERPTGKLTGKPIRRSNRTSLESDRLELLFAVVPRKKGSFFVDYISSFDVNLQVHFLAEGTASSETRDILGLTDAENLLIAAVIREDKVSAALEGLEKKFAQIKNGKGIAWTVSLTSVIGASVYGFLSNNRDMIREDRTK